MFVERMNGRKKLNPRFLACIGVYFGGKEGIPLIFFEGFLAEE